MLGSGVDAAAVPNSRNRRRAKAQAARAVPVYGRKMGGRPPFGNGRRDCPAGIRVA